MQLRNQHMVITGVNRGIGKAVALACAADAPHLHLVLRSLDLSLEEELRRRGASSVHSYVADLSQPSQVAALLAQLSTVPIDILFNNAGLLTGGLLETQNSDDIALMLSVNVAALIQLTHGILPNMLARKHGKIINHGSVSSLMYFPCASTYAAAKAAVYAFTKSLEVELRGTGVSTLVLLTAGVETAMFDNIPKLYGSNLQLNLLNGISAADYAQAVRTAILNDKTELRPSGAAGVMLRLAQHWPSLFQRLVASRFQR